MRESFIFYKSFYESLNELNDKDKLAVYNAICEYSINQNETELKGIPKAIFTLIKPQLDANNKRYENGTKGGRPKTKTKPNNNQNKTKTKPNKNVNENDNVNVNENDNVNVNKNINDIPKGIIDYLNIKANKNYKYTKNNISLINSRLKENYQVEDFKTVIDKKYNEWKNTDYEKYLQPSTLFGNKFDNYLNQNIKVNINQIEFTDEEMESLGLERLDFNE